MSARNIAATTSQKNTMSQECKNLYTWFSHTIFRRIDLNVFDHHKFISFIMTILAFISTDTESKLEKKSDRITKKCLSNILITWLSQKGNNKNLGIIVLVD